MSEPLVPLPPLPVYSDDHLASLSAAELWRVLVRDEDRVPRNVIDECARRGESILDEIENLLRQDYFWTDDITLGEWWLPLHAAMILGLTASHRAGELLVGCMLRLEEAEEDDLQDLLAPFWPALFRNKPGTIVPTLRALAENRVADWYIRACAAKAAIAHAEERSPDRLDEVLDWAAAIASDESEDIEMRASVATHLIDFARDEDRALVEALADLPEHEGRMFDRQEVEETYASGGAEREWKRFSDPWLFYDSEIMEERHRRWADEAAALDQEDDLWDEPGQTYVRPAPKVGRNDSCPCGSGKKYKKCCLPKAGQD